MFLWLWLAACSSPEAPSDADPPAETSDDTVADSVEETVVADTPVDSDPPVDTPAGPATFTPIAIDTLQGPSFITIADLTGDGAQDLIVSRFGDVGLTIPDGSVTLYERDGAGLDQWRHSTIVGANDHVIFPNRTTPFDVDLDGDLDLFVPSGFLVCEAIPLNGPCGALAWFENDAGAWRKHSLFADKPLFHHGVQLADLDGDGVTDLVTTGERIPALGAAEASTFWLKGTTSGDRFEVRRREIGDGLGSFPQLWDVDLDGDLDVVGAEFTRTNGSFAWYEQTAAPDEAAPDGVWARHVIDNDVGPSIQFELVPDLFGDGVLRGVGSNHTNTAMANPDPWDSAVFALEVPADPTGRWPRTTLSQGIVSAPGSRLAPQAAPGVFAWGDADVDGDIDVVVSGDGDPKVYLLEQTAPGVFATRVLMNRTEQAGVAMGDLNGDGQPEIVVTGYEDDTLYVLVRD